MKLGLISAIALAAMAIPAAAQDITPSMTIPIATVTGNASYWVQGSECDLPNDGCSQVYYPVSVALTGGYTLPERKRQFLLRSSDSA